MTFALHTFLPTTYFPTMLPACLDVSEINFSNSLRVDAPHSKKNLVSTVCAMS